jgi:hypothetical protein
MRARQAARVCRMYGCTGPPPIQYEPRTAAASQIRWIVASRGGMCRNVLARHFYFGVWVPILREGYHLVALPIEESSPLQNARSYPRSTTIVTYLGY